MNSFILSFFFFFRGKGFEERGKKKGVDLKELSWNDLGFALGWDGQSEGRMPRTPITSFQI